MPQFILILIQKFNEEVNITERVDEIGEVQSLHFGNMFCQKRRGQIHAEGSGQFLLLNEASNIEEK